MRAGRQLRSLRRPQHEVPPGIHIHGVEALVQLLPVQIVEIRNAVLRPGCNALEQPHQPRRITIRQRLHQRSVDKREDRQVRTHPQCQNQNRRQREPGAPPQLPHREPQVLHNRLHAKTDHLVTLLFQPRHIAKLPPRRIPRRLWSHSARR